MTDLAKMITLKPLAGRMLVEIIPAIKRPGAEQTEAGLNIPSPARKSSVFDLLEAKVVNISDDIAKYTLDNKIFIDSIVYIPSEVGWPFHVDGKQFRLLDVSDIMIPDADKTSQAES